MDNLLAISYDHAGSSKIGEVKMYEYLIKLPIWESEGIDKISYQKFAKEQKPDLCNIIVSYGFMFYFFCF